MIITAPETKIQDYIEDLRKCKEKANLELNKKRAEHTKAVSAYNSQKAILNKLKGYYTKLEATELLADIAFQSIKVVEEVLGDLVEGIEISSEGIQALANELFCFSQTLEQHLFCLEELVKAIEKIRKAKFDQNNPIVKALRELKTAHEEAIAVSTSTLVEFLKLLECAYLLQFNMVGVKEGDNLISKCIPDIPRTPNSGNTDPESEKIIEIKSKAKDLHFFDGLRGSLNKMEKHWCSQFSILPIPENGNNSEKAKEDRNKQEGEIECKYDNNKEKSMYADSINCAIKEKTTLLVSKKNQMDELAKQKENKQSKKNAADKAFEAAEKAKKC